MTVQRAVVSTPIGGIGLSVAGGALTGVSFGAGEPVEPADPSAVLVAARQQLCEYFAGERVEFDLPLAVTSGSEFERAVWQAIAAIPYGETRSYGSIARAVGQPEGAQAVGLACNRNPHPVIVACHRVIGANGKLVGFGGGLPRKRWLLQLEARIHIERTFGPAL